MVLDSAEITKHYISCCKVAISKSKAKGDNLGKYLLAPTDMIQKTWDPVYKILIKVIEANKEIFPSSDISLFEIGVGTAIYYSRLNIVLVGSRHRAWMLQKKVLINFIW